MAVGGTDLRKFRLVYVQRRQCLKSRHHR